MTREGSSKISPLPWIAIIENNHSRWYGQTQHMIKGKKGAGKEK